MSEKPFSANDSNSKPFLHAGNFDAAKFVRPYYKHGVGEYINQLSEQLVISPTFIMLSRAAEAAKHEFKNVYPSEYTIGPDEFVSFFSKGVAIGLSVVDTIQDEKSTLLASNLSIMDRYVAFHPPKILIDSVDYSRSPTADQSITFLKNCYAAFHSDFREYKHEKPNTNRYKSTVNALLNYAPELNAAEPANQLKRVSAEIGFGAMLQVMNHAQHRIENEISQAVERLINLQE